MEHILGIRPVLGTSLNQSSNNPVMAQEVQLLPTLLSQAPTRVLANRKRPSSVGLLYRDRLTWEGGRAQLCCAPRSRSNKVPRAASLHLGCQADVSGARPLYRAPYEQVKLDEGKEQKKVRSYFITQILFLFPENCLGFFCFFCYFYKFIYLFIFGCVGSLFLCEGFL